MKDDVSDDTMSLRLGAYRLDVSGDDLACLRLEAMAGEPVHHSGEIDSALLSNIVIVANVCTDRRLSSLEIDLGLPRCEPILVPGWTKSGRFVVSGPGLDGSISVVFMGSLPSLEALEAAVSRHAMSFANATVCLVCVESFGVVGIEVVAAGSERSTDSLVKETV